MTQNTTPSPARAAAIIFTFISLVIGIAIWYEAHYPAPEFIEEHSEIPADTSHSCPVGFEYYPTEMVGNCILVEGCSNDSMRRFALETMTGCIPADSIQPVLEEGEPGIRCVDTSQYNALVDSMKAGLKRRDSVTLFIETQPQHKHGPLKFDTGTVELHCDTLYRTDKDGVRHLLNPAQIDSLKAIPCWLPYGPRTTDSYYIKKVAARLGLILQNLPLPEMDSIVKAKRRGTL